MSTRQIPENQGSWVTHVVYKDAKEATTLTSEDLVAKTNELYDGTLS